MSKKVIDLDNVVVKFAGDSGDGIQLSGMQLTNTTAQMGEEVATFPDYPAEIRAPQGTIGGVSGFQLHFGKNIHTPGDKCDVLVALNPAAIMANIKMIKRGGTIIADIDTFTDKNFEKAGFKDDTLEIIKQDYKLIEAPISSMTQETLKDSGLETKVIMKSKNMFALGIVYNLFGFPTKYSEAYFEDKFKNKPDLIKANIKVLKGGFNYAAAIQAMPSFRIASQTDLEGKYRNISGNVATAWGLLAASEKTGLELFLGSYPITPASDILIEIANRKDLGAKSFQAEDEIGGIVSAIGASFAGNLAATSTSGPGLALKSEALGLAVITELPLVVVNVQRGGPSTGLPTKTEQSDLFQALTGRNGESPIPVLAASTPTNCFTMAYEAARIALEHMTPVLLLSDSYLANGTEPWLIPAMKNMPNIQTKFVDANKEKYLPYERDKNLVRSWAIPGMKNFEHRIGGLEKMDITGNVSYIAANHEKMTELREAKVEKIADFIPELKIEGYIDSDTLIVGWGSTYGHITCTVNEMKEEGVELAHAHFNYINPLPKNTADIFKKYKNIIVCELNRGQFAGYLRMKLPDFKYKQINKIQGLPFTVAELKAQIKNHLDIK
ncbi:MAG: 2-oxoacid:acceptor oxidoreductase subunit alpha [Bacteroidales bacterium]|nr:2-oxoacid:acceptor oxidoreductase subunit alpha [Bacteroidales bacterium]MDD4218004.1 2-oxoacid:acceptor oxidoreductase subunit alpha [Bacteroidales bacterium]MDY0143051.1 2-oxoacid:acceptor oxidoreductase subunit alpha [Bacteroidales bacterium]